MALKTVFSILVLTTPIAALLYWIYHENVRGRHYTLKEKFLKMWGYVVIFVIGPILLFSLYLALDITPCNWRSSPCVVVGER